MKYVDPDPDFQKKLEDFEQRKPEWQQLQALKDIADISQEMLGVLDDSKDGSNKQLQQLGVALLANRDELMKLNARKDPQTPDYSTPIVKALSDLATKLDSKNFNPTIKVEATKVDVPTPVANVSVASPSVDTKGIEKTLKQLSKGFSDAIAQIPQTIIPEYPDRWDEVIDHLKSIDNATRKRYAAPNTVATSGGGGGSGGDGAINDGVSSTIKATVFDYTNSNPLGVVLRDTNGDYVSVGGGTQYADGAVRGTATGTIAMVDDGTNIQSAKGDTDGTQQVNFTKLNSTTVDTNSGTKSAGTQRVVLATDQPQLTNALKVDGSATTQPVSGTVAVSNSFTLDATTTTTNTRIGDLTETAPASDTASSGLNGRLQRIAQRLTSLIALFPTSLGQKTKANSFAVTLASDQDALPITDNSGSLTVDNGGTFAVQDSEKVADNAAFTDGTTKVMPSGYIYDEVAGTALSENDAAAARVDSKRSQVFVIEDETTRGRRTTVTSANALKVDGSAVTQPVSAASLPLPSGAATSALQTQPGVDIGDVTINNASGASAVNIQDGGNSITVDGTVSVTGVSTLAEQQTQTTSLQLIDDVVYTDDTSTHATGTSKGVGIMATAVPTDTSVNANDIGMVAMTTDRRLLVDASGVAVPVTDNGGSLTVDGTVTANLAAGTNNIGDVDVLTVSGVAPAFGSGLRGATVQRVTIATDDVVPVTDNGGSLTVDYATTGSGTATGALRVELPTNGTGVVGLNTGSNVIGALTANQSVNVAQMNGVATSMGAGNSGTGTQRVVVATDQAVLPVSDNSGSLTVDAPVGTPVFVRLSDGTSAIATLPVSIAATVATKETRSATNTTATVAGSASVVTLIASNANRLGATIYNDSSAILYLKLGATASTSDFTAVLQALTSSVGGYYEVPFGYTGIITGIWASATGNARVGELT